MDALGAGHSKQRQARTTAGGVGGHLLEPPRWSAEVASALRPGREPGQRDHNATLSPDQRGGGRVLLHCGAKAGAPALAAPIGCSKPAWLPC